MEQPESLIKRTKKGTTKLTKNSKIFKTIVAAIQEKKGENITALDLRKIPEAVADFFIICEASSQPQIRAVAENVERKVKEHCGENTFHTEGLTRLQWVLIDYVNIVVHIMLPEVRKFYELEEIWHDAIQSNNLAI